MDLKTKAMAAALRRDEDLYLNTRNPSHVWHAWQLARRAKFSTPTEPRSFWRIGGDRSLGEL